MAVARAIFMTFGQVALYDQYKQMLIQSGYFHDTISTHFTASFLAVSHSLQSLYRSHSSALSLLTNRMES